MKKNQGLSLIELVVVIAIMGVLVGLVAISVTVLSRQKVGNAASDVKSLLQTAQTIAMSKDDCHVEIQVINGAVVFTTYSSASKVIDKLTLDKKIGVRISYDGGKNVNELGAVGIYYERESGSFSNAFVRGSTGNPKTGEDTHSALQWIEFYNSTKSVRLNLTRLTGKVSY